MKTAKRMLASVLAGAFVLLSTGAGYAEQEYRLVNCSVVTHERLVYHYGYVPVSEGSSIYRRVVKGYTEETTFISYDSNGNQVGDKMKNVTELTFKDSRMSIGDTVLIEKANRNEATGRDSLLLGPTGRDSLLLGPGGGGGGGITEEYKEGRLSKITVHPGFLTRTLEDFTFHPDGNIAGYTIHCWPRYHIGLPEPDDTTVISDIKYDENGKITGRSVRHLDPIEGRVAENIIEYDIKYNNFGDRIYWVEIHYKPVDFSPVWPVPVSAIEGPVPVSAPVDSLPAEPLDNTAGRDVGPQAVTGLAAAPVADDSRERGAAFILETEKKDGEINEAGGETSSGPEKAWYRFMKK